MQNTLTREEWLNKFIGHARPMFIEAGVPLPEQVRAALAPPHRKMKAIGLCWHAVCTSDEAREIWVSSAIADPVQAVSVLVHELCHAALPDGVGHKRPFTKLATAMLLTEGKGTHAAGGAEFAAKWEPIIAEVGPMPGAQFLGASAVGQRKQKTAAFKNVTCPSCGFLAKVTCDSLEVGRLNCPVDGEMLLTKEEGNEL